MGTCGAHAAGSVVISKVYGGGGTGGAPWQNDFVELFNRSSGPITLAGWSLQYASATGNGNFGGNPIVPLTGVLQPGQYYLIRLASNGTVGSVLPTPDASVTGLNISGSSGKVALINTPTGLACNGGSAPCSTAQLAQIVDLVGYGTANFFEVAAAPTLTNSLAALRLNGGCTDSDDNSTDFQTGTPSPRNTAATPVPCTGGPVNAPIVPSCPATAAVQAGSPAFFPLDAVDPDGTVTSAIITSAAVPGIAITNVTAGSHLTATLEVSASVLTGTYPVAIRFANSDSTPQTAACTVQVIVSSPAGVVRIHEIQGRAHISALNGQSVTRVPGIVTGVRSNGYYMQDPLQDTDPATSEAIFVFTNQAPQVTVGTSVEVTGTVSEFRPGGADGLTNLTTTEIVSPLTAIVSFNVPLPPAVVLGAGGRAIPTMVIDDDANGDVETSGSFDVTTDGIDFMESLEGMRVQINNAVASGPTNSFGEIPVLADDGAGAQLRSARGGVLISSTNLNPQRLFLDDGFLTTPSVNVGAHFGTVTAIVDYSFGNFKFNITGPLTVTDNALPPETTQQVGTAARLTVGSFNVENLAPNDPPAKFAQLAGQIVQAQRSPDVVALMEVQDNNGATNDAVVDATTTFNALIAAIQMAGGPQYQFRSINPVDDQDGGAQGGNIRVGFLFNPARVSFVDRAGGGPTVATTVVSDPAGPRLSASPGRIDPTNGAFANSRKPLVGEFLFNGRKLFVVANHFNSKLGDDPLFGHLQPPVRSSEVQRHQQAAVVNGFVRNILTLDPNASVVVLGDLNDFEFSDTLTVLKSGNALVDLVDTLPPSERYTYVFDGNSQVLDHTLVSPALATFAQPVLDVVHLNAEYAARPTDHDPEVTSLRLHRAGDVDGDGDIDRADVDAITAARNTAANGPYDPRNLNGDTRIDALDARLAVQACTRQGCVSP